MLGKHGHFMKKSGVAECYKIASEAARTVPGRENGGNCDIKNLSIGCTVYFPLLLFCCPCEGRTFSVVDVPHAVETLAILIQNFDKDVHPPADMDKFEHLAMGIHMVKKAFRGVRTSLVFHVHAMN